MGACLEVGRAQAGCGRLVGRQWVGRFGASITLALQLGKAARVVASRALSREQFNLLSTTDHWSINEVPREHWDRIPGLQRLHDTVAIMASGSYSPGIPVDPSNDLAQSFIPQLPQAARQPIYPPAASL
jgi:hypothetical protein